MFHPVVRRRLGAAVGALLVSGHERAPETHQPAAHVPEQEAHRDTGGAAEGAAQVLPEVTRHLKLLAMFKCVFFLNFADIFVVTVPCSLMQAASLDTFLRGGTTEYRC